MLDAKKVGSKIASLRKITGYSQDNLASLLNISPQAISKWENGHTLPETSLLPVLSQLFNCSIDEIIMPAYNADEKSEQVQPTILEQQAEYIALHVVNHLEKKKKEYPGLSDDEIADAILKINPIEDFVIEREKESRTDGKINRKIRIVSSQKEIKLVEQIYHKRQDEFNGYAFLNGNIKNIPQIYYIDFHRKLILMDDLSEDYFKGYDFNENNQNGIVFRQNYHVILRALANFHSMFWENYTAFEKIGLCWQHCDKENMLAWINDAMEKPLKKYINNEKLGKIPKIGIGENNITSEELKYYEKAVEFLKIEYAKIVYERYNTGKNITVIHGDLHPGQILMSKSTDRNVMFSGVYGVRMGLCTEDLSMLIALHIASDNKILSFNDTKPLLDYYYQCLCEEVKDYSYETFINDYKISVTENLFFPIRLINRDIYDFHMRDKAIKAFETFVL